jgi:hypothetical protein
MKILKKNKYSILQNVLKYSFVLVIVFSIFVSISFAADGGAAGSINIKTGIENPLGDDLNDIPSFITAIINIVLVVGVPIVTLAIIYSGFLFVSAQGSAEKLKKAKDALIATLIGAALLLGAFILAEAIKGTVDDIKTTT